MSKKIMFFAGSLDPSTGGVARVTDRLVSYLTEHGWACYGVHSVAMSMFNEGFLKLIRIDISKNDKIDSVEQLSEFVKDNEISVIINQQVGNKLIDSLFRAVADKTGAKLIGCFHVAPDFYINHQPRYNFTSVMQGIRSVTKYMIYPLYRQYQILRLRNIYNFSYDQYDKYILLSEAFIPAFTNIYRIKNSSKLCAISNPLTFDSFYDPERLTEKENIVLIVSRLEENQKRISLALKIWHSIEQNKECDNWRLVIVGGGPDDSYYRDLSIRLNLKRVKFEGVSNNVIGYYCSASVFMMTSYMEGFGITLIEAQQQGCVPIAFESFSSLHDIIDDNIDGKIVVNKDMNDYYRKISALLTNEAERHRMAINAINNSHKFSLGSIGDKWLQLINKITYNE